MSKEIRENLSKNIEITSSDYLVPKFNENFDITELISKEYGSSDTILKNFSEPRVSKRTVKDKFLDKRLGESKFG